MPSIIQLLKKVLPPGSILISGEIGLYNEVSWVISVRPSPPGFESLKGNEFVLIRTDLPSGLCVTPVQLVSTLIEMGVSGIGISGKISSEVQREAQTHRTPLIQLPETTNINTLENTIIQLIAEERKFLYQHEREYNHTLMNLALAGSCSLDIIQKLRNLTGRNLGFIDLNYNPHFPLDPRLADALRKQMHQAVSKLRTESVKIASPVIGLNLLSHQACFLGLIRVGKEIKGYLMLTAPEESISEIDRLAVRAGTLALAVEMSRRQAVEETEARFESDIMENLLTGDFPSENAIEIARRLDLNPAQPYVCLLIHPSSLSCDTNAIQKSLSSLLSNTNYYFRGENLIVLYQLESFKTAVELRQLGKIISDSLSPTITGEFTLGIGRSYKGLDGIRTSFREAEQALTMGLQLFGAGSVTCFADLGIYRLLFLLKQTGELAAFHQEYLGSLLEYDNRHEGELIQTLKVYLHYNTIADTARTIHIHRNTLLYRLSRIQDITGADLQDGKTRLTFHIAILAGEVLQLN